MIQLSKNLILVFAMLFPVCAMAQSEDSGAEDEVPDAPRITKGESPGFKSRAGIGGDFAFAEAGVIELGGSFGLTSADDFTEFSATPSAGYFFADNMQISALATWHYSEVEDETSNVGTFLAEPSIHLPLTNTRFVFLGLGFGGLFEKGEKPGAAIAPRVGYKNLIGRSGMLTFAVQSVFGMNESEVQTSKGTVLTVENALHAAVGYSVLL